MPSLKPIVIKRAGTAPWLYAALRRLVDNGLQAERSVGSIIRGEIPDGSGTPLVDTTKFFFKPGLPGGQLAFGSTAAGGLLTFSSTANSVKGFIHLGSPSAKLSVDETQSFIGINKSAPSATLHIVGSSSGSGSSLVPNSDINGLPAFATGWRARTGSGGSTTGTTLFSAMATDDGLTNYGAVNPGGGGDGINPQRCGLNGTITPGAMYTITIKYCVLFTPWDATTNNAIGVELVDSTGTRWPSWSGASGSEGAGFNGTNAPADQPCPGAATFVTRTLTVTCSGTSNGTGGTPNSINCYLSLVSGASSLYGGVTLVSVAQAGSGLVRWDLASGTQSGGIDIAGRLGIGTGSASLDSEITAVADTSGTIGLKVKAATSQSADLLQITNSSGTSLSGFTSAGAPYLIAGKGANKFLQSDANGVGSWVAQAALTKTDDTNVTLTLGGSPTIALTAATSLTLGWTGQLSIARGGTGQSSATAAFNALSPLTTRGDLLTRDATNNIRLGIGTQGQLLISDGTDPAWGNTINQAVSTIGLKIVNEATPSAGNYAFVITDHSGNPLAFYDSAAGDVFQAPNMIAGASFGMFDPVGGGLVQFVANSVSGAVITIPDLGSQTLAFIGGIQTFTAKTFATSCNLVSSTASTGVPFQDTTTSSKKLRHVLSGAVGNNSFTLANTAARDYKFEDVPGTVIIVGNGANPPASGAMGKVNLTAQGAAIAATNLTNTTPAGYYEVSYTLEDTTADVTAGTIQFQISYTDDIGATTQTGAALAMTATGRDRGLFQVYLASGNITYQTNLTGIFGTAKYALRVRVRFLG